MGCDIHSFVERKNGDKWELVERLFEPDEYDKERGKKHRSAPFDWRSYGMFGFLADVRNYSRVPTIAERRGLPEDASEVVKADAEDWSGDSHSHSWLTVSELATFDYDKTFEDRRTMKNGDGAALADEGKGEMVAFREFLGDGFFRDLDALKTVSAEWSDTRIVFWFDN